MCDTIDGGDLSSNIRKGYCGGDWFGGSMESRGFVTVWQESGFGRREVYTRLIYFTNIFFKFILSCTKPYY